MTRMVSGYVSSVKPRPLVLLASLQLLCISESYSTSYLKCNSYFSKTC